MSPWQLWLAAVSLVFVAAFAVIAPRQYEASDPGLRIRGDALPYIELARGTHPSKVEGPLRYRVLVPWLARALPLPAHRALQLLTMVCLIGTLAALYATGLRLNFPRLDALLGVLAVSLMSCTLYAFHNPYLTDLFGVLMVSASVYALIVRRPALFAALVTVGVAGRESVVFIAPAYILTVLWTRDRRESEGAALLLAGILLPMLAFLIPRALPMFGPDGLASYSGAYAGTLRDLTPLRHPIGFAVAIAMSWEWLWIVAVAGLLAIGLPSAPIPPTIRPWSAAALRVSFGLLVTGGIVTLFANGMVDAGRHFLPAAPPVAVGAMMFTHRLRPAVSGAAFWTVVALVTACSMVTLLVQLPNRAISSAAQWAVPLYLVSGASALTVAISAVRALGPKRTG